MSKKFKEILKEIEEGKHKKSGTIGTVDYYIIEKTPYSFHFYAVYPRNGRETLTEMLYDLRYKEFFMKRNGREVMFNVANLDTVVPRTRDRYYRDDFYNRDNIPVFFDMVSVEENKGMYEAMVNAIGSLGAERVDMSSRALIRLITEYNKLELVYKAGIDINVVRDSQVGHLIRQASIENKRRLHQVFGVTKAQLRFLTEHTEGDRYRFVNSLSRIAMLPQNVLDSYTGYGELVMELEERYNVQGRWEIFRRRSGLREYINAYATKEKQKNGDYAHYDRDFYSFVVEYDHPNPRKLLEYLLFECLLSQGIEFWSALQEYRDYYRMCMDLGYERFDRYPKYLKTFHDIVARNYNEVKDEVANKKFTEATSKYTQLEASLRGYSVVVPEDPKDLVYEGNILQHCVASYVKNVAEERTKIVFLRDNKDVETPLVTVEIRGYDIVQARGQANRLPTEDERDALRRFANQKGLEVKTVV